uniref:Probable zinc-ribbon domain-containing protein n=1 Tax=Arundo donax TaxID=35708 RepID=A0A0A9F360_ARUDO
MTGASTADRLETNKMADVQNKSVYSRHDNIQTGPNASNLNTTVRDDGREAKYRYIRDWENGEMGQSLRVRDISPRSPIDGIPPNAYCGEGLADHHLKPRYRYSNREHSDEMDGPSRVRGLEKDRAEILRMLDELRDQVQQSCDVADEPNRSAPTNRAADAQSSHGTCDRLNKFRHDAPQLHRNGSHHSPLLNVRSPSIPVYAAALPAQQDHRGYAEPIAHTRASSYPAGLYPWRNFDSYFFGQHDADPLLSCRHDGFYHQAACSCLHCCHREFLPVHGNHLSFNDQRAPYRMNNYGAYPVDSPLFGQQRYSTRGTDTTLQRNRTRVNISKKPAETCEPVAGGAPFTICYNCYEVLQLPKKQSLSVKGYKLRCGSCSQAIVVKLDGTRLDVSEFALSRHLSAGQQNSINNSMGTNEQTAFERSVPAYCFSDGSHASQEKDLHSNLSESENNHNPLGTNSEDTSQSRDLPSEASVVSCVPRLPHGDHCGLSPSEYSGVGSRSTDSEPEKVILLAERFKQSSIKDVCVANEKQTPENEFDGPECTDDALNVQQNADHARVTKAGDSFLTNLIKKSFKINNRTRNGRTRVYVNGFPISDRAVRKAEKLAGAICPGDYWYDYCAGFWGVMRHPCFGMIPPYIPEFNYPMPKNCAGGNTGVFVNGRELHQKDLDLLVARGLSDSPGRSYIVENSGKVSDEATGEELYGLGNLAPTVEKMRRGFGMRVPRVIQ